MELLTELFNVIGMSKAGEGVFSGGKLMIPSVQTMLFLAVVFIVYKFLKGSEMTFKEGVQKRVEQVKENIISWRNSILQMFYAVFTSQEWKYDKPWYLIVGCEGSQEDFIVQSVQSRLGEGDAIEDKGVILEYGNAYSLLNGTLITLKRKEQDNDKNSGEHEVATAESRQYQTLAEELVQVRSQRPLDGIILVIPAIELEKGHAYHSEKSNLIIADRIRRIQESIEFSLPLYLLISESQTIDSFEAFWNVQPRDIDRQQPFGWISPYSAETVFKEKHIVQALNDLKKSLNTIQLNTEISEENTYTGKYVNGSKQDVDGFLAFPSRLKQYYLPIKKLTRCLFLECSVGHLLPFRGVFFSGRLPATSENEHQDKGQTAYFVDHFIDKVVFGDGMVAEPTRRRKLSRNRHIHKFQIASLCVSLLLFSSLFFTNRSLDEQVDSISVVVKNIQEWRSRGIRDCSDLNTAEDMYSMLASMASINTDLVYWNIPFSWWESVSSDVQKEFSDKGMKSVVFPNLQCRIQRQAKELSRIPSVMGSLESEQSEVVSPLYVRLERYMKDLVSFERNLDDFKKIAPRQNANHAFIDNPMSLLIRLMESLYGKEAPEILRRANGQHQKSLVRLNYNVPWMENYQLKFLENGIHEYCDSLPELSRFDRREPISEALIASNICLMSLALYDNILSTSGFDNFTFKSSEASEQLESFTLTQAIDNNPKQAYDSMVAWTRIAARFYSKNPAEDTPCNRVYSVLKNYGDALLLDANNPDKNVIQFLYAPMLEFFQPGGVCDQQAKGNIQKVKSVLMKNTSGNESAIIAKYVESSMSATFFKQTRALPEGQELGCKADLSEWDAGQLSLAEKYVREYHTFITDNQLDDVDPTESPLKQLAYSQVKFAIEQVLYNAQVEKSSPAYIMTLLNQVDSQESKLASTKVNFDRAIAHLIPLAKDLNELKFNDVSSEITRCARKYAIHMIAQVNNYSEPLGLYKSLPKQSRNLPLNSDFSFTLYNKADLDDYLETEEKRTRIVLEYLEPALVLLGQTEINDGSKWQQERPSIAFWRNTLTDFTSYQRELANTQLGELHALYKRLASDENLCASVSELPIGGYGYDLFAKRRSHLALALSDMCNIQLEEAISQTYQFMHDEYNQKFGGKYPFNGDSKSATEASAAELRQFLIANAGAVDNLLKQIETLVPQSSEWKKLENYLKQLQSLESVFSTSLAHQPQPLPIYLSTKFDLVKETNLISSQSTRWQLGSNRFSISNVDESQQGENPDVQLPWYYGDSLSLSINWSKDSPYIVDTQKVKENSLIDSVNANLKSLGQTLTGDWALFRLLDLYRIDKPPAGVITSNQEQVMLIPVPLILDPDLIDSRAYADIGQNPVTANLYMSVVPLVKNSQGNLEPLSISTVFPASAPSLPGGFYAYY